MKIKKFRATDSAKALRMIRDELGEDAAILTSYIVPDGVEYVVTTDALATEHKASAAAIMIKPGAATAFYDWQSELPIIKSDMLAQTVAAAAVEQVPMIKDLTVDTVRALMHGRQTHVECQEADTAMKAPEQLADILALKQELGSMRSLLETHLKQFALRDQRLQQRFAVPLAAALNALDLSPELTRDIAGVLPAHATNEQIKVAACAHLKQSLSLSDKALNGTFVLLGASGSGKTMTLVKLAARHVLTHGNSDIALISTDAARVGTLDQLRAYGRILKVPVVVANSAEELRHALYLLRDKCLVLIDTPAINSRDHDSIVIVKHLLAGAPQATQLLTLAADSETHVVNELINACYEFDIHAVTLTRLDVAARLGALLSQLISARLPLAWCSAGARVPHDLSVANVDELVVQAWSLANGRVSSEPDAESLHPLAMSISQPAWLPSLAVGA